MSKNYIFDQTRNTCIPGTASEGSAVGTGIEAGNDAGVASDAGTTIPETMNMHDAWDSAWANTWEIYTVNLLYYRFLCLCDYISSQIAYARRSWPSYRISWPFIFHESTLHNKKKQHVYTFNNLNFTM